MAWPPTLNSTAYLLAAGFGNYVLWGTDGLSSYIVESCRPTDEIENIPIQNGSGMTVGVVTLWDGRQIAFTLIDDYRLTPPTPGSLWQIQDPTSGSLLYFRVTGFGYSVAPKTPGRREITAEYKTMIEGNGTVPPI